MSYLLEFPSISPLPRDASAPPLTIFGVYGTDITSSLPPRMPFKLVLHFAPALRKWSLPISDPTCLPRTIARKYLHMPCVSIDIQAPIDAAGLGCIIVRMFRLSGCRVRKETFGVQPDLTTTIAIHNAWLELELPVEGVRGLHTHIYDQLIYTEPPVSVWGMALLWDAFSAGPEIIKAMGLNFIRGHMNMEYTASQRLEIIAWFQSTPERSVLFNSLRNAMSEVLEPEVETIFIATDEAKKVSGYKTIGKKVGKVIKKVVFGNGTSETHDLGIMERGATRKVSPQEKQEREASDFEAVRKRLRRTSSHNNLRSFDTVMWNPQTPEEEEAEVEEEATVNDDMDDESNYSGNKVNVQLALTLEKIHMRREARNAKQKRPPSLQPAMLTTENSQRSDEEEQPVINRRVSLVLRHRRSQSTMITGRNTACPSMTCRGGFRNRGRSRTFPSRSLGRSPP